MARRGLVCARATGHGEEISAVQNILVVSDLHFGEELLPGASLERRSAVELGARAFREFLRYHTVRRLGGRPWRLVIAGDLFDFMSVAIHGMPGQPAKTSDERRFGLQRTPATGVARLDQILEAHRDILVDLVAFAAAGHQVDIIVGNHDVELLEPVVVAEFERHLKAAGGDAKALARIAVVPWFVHVPGLTWIEHGHVYDEGCSFEFNLAPTDPKDGLLVFNADYAAVRYLGTAVPELDPHGIEEWGFWGYLRYAWELGPRPFARLWLAYARFTWALFAARGLHRSPRRRDRRRREHATRLGQVASAGGVPLATASAIDRMARMPMTYSFRRLGRMVMLDRFGLGFATLLVALILLLALPLGWALAGIAVTAAAAGFTAYRIGPHHVTSQLPMRSVPARIRKLIEVPFVVFGHTHDPRLQMLPGGGIYLNSGTWLPATRPGLRRSFTHVVIQPGIPASAELRQWRDGTSLPFDAGANLGAGGMTNPGIALAEVRKFDVGPP